MSPIGRIADRKRGELVRSYISKEMAILDLGCGTGWLVELLRREGYDAIGIDPNLPDSNLRGYLLRRSAYETGFVDSSFDCITCLETIEHLEPRVYAEIRRISKHRGKLIVTTPKKRWNPLIELLSSAGLADPLVTAHINLVSPQDIPFLLEESGPFMWLEWYGV
jgi:2-polyprenyl-3-methyl-5-hydroxy-6-metoxy-1,4-benzoquinol methylase